MTAPTGRWTLWVDGKWGEVLEDQTYIRADDREIPVVPCDEAAVGRAARAIQAVESSASATEYNTGSWFFEAARAALRAAGEDSDAS